MVKNLVQKAMESAMKKQQMSGTHKNKQAASAKGAKVTGGFGKGGKSTAMQGAMKKSGGTKYHGAM